MEELIPTNEENDEKPKERLLLELQQLITTHNELFSLVHNGKTKRRALQKQLEHNFIKILQTSPYNSNLTTEIIIQSHTNLSLIAEEVQLLKNLMFK